MRLALDRTALIGRASSWANWTVQAMVYGLGAVLCWTTVDGAAGTLIAIVVLLSLAEGAARLRRRAGDA